MTQLSWPEGSFSWADLNSPDTAASAAFYGAIFGWTHEEMGADYGSYVMFYKDGKEVAGMGPQPAEMQGAPAIWSSYVAVDSVDATAQRVVDAGGEIFMPAMDVGDRGRMAFFKDPGGAAFGVWQALEHSGAQVHQQTGSRCWTELLTRDVDRTGAFYLSVFPYEATVRDMGGQAYTMFMLGEQPAGGMMDMGQAFPAQVPAFWLSYWVVDSLEQTMAQVAQLGGQAISPIVDLPGTGRVITFSDPLGGVFAVMEPPAGEG